MSVRSLNGLSSVFVNTIQAGDAINVVSSGTSISTVNVDIDKQTAKTTPVNSDVFLLEESNGNIKKITFQNLSNNIDTNFWNQSNDILRPIRAQENSLLVGGTNMNVNNFKFQVEGNSYINGNLLVETDTNTSNRQLLINGTAEVTSNIYLNTISSGTWNGSVLGKAYLPTDTVYDADIANFITLTDLTTAVNFSTAQGSAYTLGRGGSDYAYTNTIKGWNIKLGETPNSDSSDTATVGTSTIDLLCKTGGADNTINISASPVWNQGVNSTINITASSRSGVLGSGASNINITANDNSFSNSNGCRITLSALTEVIINTGFKINSTGAISAVGSKITNNFIDTGTGDNKIVEIDTPSSTVATNDYARFTANGLEGRSYAEVASDIGSSITTVGTITTGTWNGNIIATTKGGTGLSTYTTGNIIYASATNTLNNLAIGSNNYFLMSNGTIPVWQNGYSFDTPLQVSGLSVSLSGLSGFGNSNQIIATNGSNSLVYTTLNAGTNISIGATSGNITISSSENYWERNSNVSSFDLQTNSTVDNIVLTVPLSTNNTFTTSNTFVSTSSLKSTLGLISGGGEYIKFVDYSSTKPLELKGIINTPAQATFHMAFKHDSTGSQYPLLKQDINSNLYFHWNGLGDKYTFKYDGDALFSGIISPTSSNEECFLSFGSTVLTNTFHRTDCVKLKIAANSSYSAGTEPGFIELVESASSSSNTTRLYFNSASTAYIYWDGTNLLHSPSFAPSDSRLKKNETLANTTELSNAFDKIDIYKYQYQEQYAIDKGADPDKYVYGFIAQNIKENTDNLSSQFCSVGKGQAIYPNNEIDYEGDKLVVDNLLTINKTDVNLLLWGKIKEMDAIIKNQQIVINNLLSATTFANFKKMNIN